MVRVRVGLGLGVASWLYLELGVSLGSGHGEGQSCVTEYHPSARMPCSPGKMLYVGNWFCIVPAAMPWVGPGGTGSSRSSGVRVPAVLYTGHV